MRQREFKPAQVVEMELKTLAVSFLMNTAMLLTAGNWSETLGLTSKGFCFDFFEKHEWKQEHNFKFK